ncbi:MAG TPA: VWA domain-containing protein [Vicinamibacteria bacterium]
MRPFARLACVLLLSATAAHTAPVPQTPQVPAQVPVFGSEVELITVDAVVLNKLGKAVPGLTSEDFQVSEDGKPVEIVSFEAVVEPDEEPQPATASFSSEAAGNEPGAVTAGRAFAIVIDDLGMAPERSADAREAIRAFLERGVRAGDEVILGTASGDAWWSGRIPEGREDLLAVAARARGKYDERFSTNQMTDYEAFWITNHEDTPALAQSAPGGRGDSSGRASSGGPESLPSGAGGVRERVRKRWEAQMLCLGPACEPMLRGRAAQLDAARRSRTQATLGAIGRGIEALRPIHGRKSLLLVSQGFVNDPGDRRTRNVVALSREANTAVYFLDVRGLQAMRDSGAGSAAEASPGPGAVMDSFVADRGTTNFEESVLSSTGSEGLASDTGGFSVRNTNDLGGGAERIADESRVFYLLGFNATEGKPAQAWRKLQVSTKRPGLEVRARKGYTLAKAASAFQPPKKGKERGPDPAVLRAIDSPHHATGLPMRARVYVLEPGAKQTRVLVAAEFDTSALGPGSDKPRRLEMSAVVRMRDEPLEFRYDQAVELKQAAAGTTWRAIAREFGVPPGAAAVRVVLHDPATRTLGSVSARFEVPKADVLRLSTPILTDRVEPARADGENPRPALAVSRAFPKDAGLYCQFEVVGAKKGPDGKARVAAGVSVFAANGKLVRESPSSPVAVDAEGRSVRLVGIDLAGLPEGSYDLVLDVQDEIGHARLRQREPFTIEGPGD